MKTVPEKKTSRADAAASSKATATPQTTEKRESPAETLKTQESPLLGKFFIKQAKDGSYMFNLKASNGEIVVTSDMYSSAEKCRKGIASVQTNAPIANVEDHTVKGAIDEVPNPKFEIYCDKGGNYRFRLKAKNGLIIAKSQGYSSKSNCKNGLESVRKNAMSDEIVLEEPANTDATPVDKIDPEPIPAKEEPKEPVTLLGKFVIKRAKDGSMMFNLKASNGEIVATSEMYSSLEKCKKGIASVQLNAPIANFEDHTVNGAIEEVINPKFEMYQDKIGEYRFRLKAKNGSIIAQSQGYSNKTNCKNGIESARKNAMTDVIVTEEPPKDKE